MFFLAMTYFCAAAFAQDAGLMPVRDTDSVANLRGMRHKAGTAHHLVFHVLPSPLALHETSEMSATVATVYSLSVASYNGRSRCQIASSDFNHLNIGDDFVIDQLSMTENTVTLELLRVSPHGVREDLVLPAMTIECSTSELPMNIGRIRSAFNWAFYFRSQPTW